MGSGRYKHAVFAACPDYSIGLQQRGHVDRSIQSAQQYGNSIDNPQFRGIDET